MAANLAANLYGAFNEKSSAWIRVSQGWAGAKFGAMAIPRIGQEVIVDFVEGDPDEPIVVGRTYNALNLPPYDLPANKTKMTIKRPSKANPIAPTLPNYFCNGQKSLVNKVSKF